MKKLTLVVFVLFMCLTKPGLAGETIPIDPKPEYFIEGSDTNCFMAGGAGFDYRICVTEPNDPTCNTSCGASIECFQILCINENCFKSLTE